MNKPVVIVGAGLSGLTCARTLHAQGVPVQVLERDSTVGGRVQTDVVKGFRLDRGFQILLTGYPELAQHLDLSALDLRTFDPGAVLWTGQRFETIGDPLRAPSSVLPTLFARSGTLRDKLEILRLRRDLLRGEDYSAFSADDGTTLEYLQARGFSPRFIEQFFRPFLGGVFLEPNLETTARFFQFVFRMFSAGSAAVPAQGMGRIPAQLAADLPSGAVSLNTGVSAVRADAVRLEDGPWLEASAVVVATDATAAARLVRGVQSPPWRAVTCFYFAADRAPSTRKALHLDAVSGGPINNLHVASAVSPDVAPAGKHLISATCLGEANDPQRLRDQVLRHAETWFGEQVRSWDPLRHYVIGQALPAQPAGALEPPRRPTRHGSGVYLCGDYLDQASIDGAMVSGRRAAQSVLADQVRDATG